MRRRRVTLAEHEMPADLAELDLSRWPGDSDYQRWEAWNAARKEWAEVHLPGGADALPDRSELVPDQPWDESEI